MRLFLGWKTFAQACIGQAFNPVAIVLISWTFRIQDPNKKLFLIVCMISGGVALASYGELRFDLFGFITQALAVGVSFPSAFISQNAGRP